MCVIAGPVGGVTAAEAAANVAAAEAGVALAAEGVATVASTGTIGACAAGSAAASVASGGSATAATLGLLSNPVGWTMLAGVGMIALGADDFSWDCWKPVLRQSCPEPSAHGRLIKDVLADPRVRDFSLQQAEGNFRILVTNVWGETFDVRPVQLPWGETAAHATLVN